MPLESPASPQPEVLVQPVVVTQPDATPHSSAATPHAVAGALHTTVVTQPAITPHAVAAASHPTVVALPARIFRSVAGAQPASTSRRTNKTLPTGMRPATIETPAGPERLQSSRCRKSLAKARPRKRAASEFEASASEEDPLPEQQSAAARQSNSLRLAKFNYAGSRFADFSRHSESRLPSR